MTTTTISSHYTGPVTTIRPNGIEAMAYRLGTTLVAWSRAQTRAHFLTRERQQQRFREEAAQQSREQNARILIGAARR